MRDQITFEVTVITDPVTHKSRDAVAVIRNGHEVAVLPEADRARRALNLPLEEIERVVGNFKGIMGREPTHDEQEFWRAVLEFKRGQS